MHLLKDQKPILYAAALDKEGFLNIARKAPKKKPYSCINCGNLMRVRRGPIRRAHFAHINKDFDSTCSPETVLHKAFKMALHKRFRECITKSVELPVKWKCQLCGKLHEGNFVKRAHISKLEHEIGDFVADVALLDIDQSAFCAIEVVVTNPPKEEKIAFYKDSGIWMTIFQLAGDEDMEMAYDTPLIPTSFDFCPDTFRKNEINPKPVYNFGAVTSLSSPDFSSERPNQSAITNSADNNAAVGYLNRLEKRH